MYFDACFSLQIATFDQPRQWSFAAIFRVCSQKLKILCKLWLRVRFIEYIGVQLYLFLIEIRRYRICPYSSTIQCTRVQCTMGVTTKFKVTALTSRGTKFSTRVPWRTIQGGGRYMRLWYYNKIYSYRTKCNTILKNRMGFAWYKDPSFTPH